MLGVYNVPEKDKPLMNSTGNSGKSREIQEDFIPTLKDIQVLTRNLLSRPVESRPVEKKLPKTVLSRLFKALTFRCNSKMIRISPNDPNWEWYNVRAVYYLAGTSTNILNFNSKLSGEYQYDTKCTFDHSSGRQIKILSYKRIDKYGDPLLIYTDLNGKFLGCNFRKYSTTTHPNPHHHTQIYLENHQYDPGPI